MLPTLTCSILTFKRPWYAVLNLMSFFNHIRYDGPKRYVVSDGGSPDWNLQLYRELLKDKEHEIVVSPSGRFSDMFNAIPGHSGEIWLTALDDFILERSMNFTNDVQFLLDNPDVGTIRYGNMNNWDVPNQTVYAELREKYRLHYWVLDKARCTANYMWTLGYSLTHRRMWDAYGPIAQIEPHQPGETELQMNRQFRERSGPTIAVPMRVGQESDMYIPMYETIRHIGYVRTDEYTKLWNQRWGAT